MPALGLDFERTLGAPLPEVRRALLAALRDAGFEVTAEQLTRVEAKRGSRLFGGSLMPARMLPVAVQFDLSGNGAGSSFVGHFVDQHLNLGGKAWGWNQSYRKVFGEAVAVIDKALAHLDPQAAAAFAPGKFWTKGGDIAILEQLQSRSAEAGAVVFDKANEVLEGGAHDQAPSAWKGVDSVAIASMKGVAVLSLEETQAHLGVAVMIASEPGGMPANLRADVEAFATRVESALSASPGRAVTLQLSPPEEPVFAFLHQQARIRDGLPARTLHVCRTCHMQKITNEDFERLQTRNQRLRNIVGGVGATISGHGIQPFIVLGQLFRLKKLDPDYVCPRCQGLDADEYLVTFCPRCGELRRESVLRRCPHCQYDFPRALAEETLWLTPEAAAELLQPRSATDAQPGVAAIAPTVAVAAQIVAPPLYPTPPTFVADPPPAVSAGGPPAPGVVPPVSTQAAVGRHAFCPFCGSPVGAGFAFCPSCGERLDAAVRSTDGAGQ